MFGIDIFFTQNLAAQAELIGIGEFLARGSSLRVCIDIVMLGVSGGMYIVPLYALVQQRSEPRKRARIIAANNVLNALFMVSAAVYGLVALGSGVTIPMLFLIMALMNIAVVAFIFTLVPEFIMRLLVWLLVHTLYRVKKTNLDWIPETGPAVLVCNHVSFVDALVLAGCVRRPIRFVMYYRIFQLPVLSFVFKTAGAIPIAGAREDPEMMQRAFDEVAAALDNDEIVGIFPEGKITEDGEMQPFRPGHYPYPATKSGTGDTAGTARPVGQFFQPGLRQRDAAPGFRAGCSAASRWRSANRWRRRTPHRKYCSKKVLGLRGDQR